MQGLAEPDPGSLSPRILPRSGVLGSEKCPARLVLVPSSWFALRSGSQAPCAKAFRCHAPLGFPYSPWTARDSSPLSGPKLAEAPRIPCQPQQASGATANGGGQVDKSPQSTGSVTLRPPAIRKPTESNQGEGSIGARRGAARFAIQGRRESGVLALGGSPLKGMPQLPEKAARNRRVEAECIRLISGVVVGAEDHVHQR